MNRTRTFTVIGAAIGFSLFLATALLPSLMYGGYVGVMMATGIFGAPLDPNLVARAIVGLGMLVGVFGTAAAFTAAGAATARLVYRLASPAAREAHRREIQAHGR
jgi:uncharacterized membrane protein